jgi:RimJ/RimL family protein N-acetyltransferase
MNRSPGIYLFLSKWSKIRIPPALSCPYSLERYRSEFAKPDIVYLSILNAGELARFFMLALDPDHTSVELRRIVIAQKGIGPGQDAILPMEDYCRERIGRSRIWLDVFDFNHRGQHVYQKLGYRRFN